MRRIRLMFQVVVIVLGLGLSMVAADEIWNSGNFSISGSVPAMGWNQTATTPFRLAMVDDFTLTAPADLTKLTIWGHMPGNTVQEPQVEQAFVRILTDIDGQPGDVIYGGWETPLHFTETATGFNQSGSSSSPIFRIEIDLGVMRLCPGTYWIQYNVDNDDIRPSTGTAIGNYFSQLATPAPPGANGRQMNVLNGQFFSLQGNAPAFIIEGTLYEACATGGGDQDGDGLCTAADVPLFVTRLLSDTFHGCADANGDCVADGRDVQAFVNCVGS